MQNRARIPVLHRPLSIWEIYFWGALGDADGDENFADDAKRSDRRAVAARPHTVRRVGRVPTLLLSSFAFNMSFDTD